jgi:hypothetical protein
MSRQLWAGVAGALRWVFAIAASVGVTSIFLNRSGLHMVIVLMSIVFGSLIGHGLTTWWRQRLVAPRGPATKAAMAWSRGVQFAGFAITLGSVAVNLLAPPDSRFRLPVALVLGASVLAETMWPKYKRPRRNAAPAGSAAAVPAVPAAPVS